MIRIKCPYCTTNIRAGSTGANAFQQTCSHIQRRETGIWDCIGEDTFYWNELTPDDAKKFLELAKTIGWREALYQSSMADNPAILNYNKADWFLYLPDTIKTSLDIGSGLGAIPFILSEWVAEVWSLERVLERLEFQAIRGQQENRTNLHFIRSRAFPLPFPDNSFDLVSINGVLEWIGLSDFSQNPRKLQQEFLQEVYRILRPDGFVYIGIESRFGLQYLLGAPDHSALPYTSLVPRKLADTLVRKFREQSQRKRTHPVVWNDYRTYTYTQTGYQKLLAACGFGDVEFYWALPGYSDPRWSGKLDEQESLAFFVERLEQQEIVAEVRGDLKKLAASILLSPFGKACIKLFIRTGLYKFFMPSYLIFGYKGEKQQHTFEDHLKFGEWYEVPSGKTLAYLRRNNRGPQEKLTFYGVDASRQLRQIAMTTRFSEYQHVLKNEQQGQMFNSTPPVIKEYSIGGREVIVFQPFKTTKVDFYVQDKVFRSIDWLQAFHKKTAHGQWNVQEIEEFLQQQLEAVQQTLEPLLQQFFVGLRNTGYAPCKVGEHGDFCTQNLLMLQETQEIYVVDWEFYNPTGEEFFDFVKLIVDVLPEYWENLNGNKVRHFTQMEPIKTYIEYFVKKQNLPVELIISYIPVCLGRVAARHYARSGKNKYFRRYVSMLEELLEDISGNAKTRD